MGRGIVGHGQRLGSLAPVKPGQVRDEAFNDEHRSRVENACHVAEALASTLMGAAGPRAW